MPTKIENINDIKESIHTEEQVPTPVTEPTTTENPIIKLLTNESRQAVVTKLDNLLSDSEVGLYEAMLGFTDLFTSTFISVMNQSMPPEEREGSNERINYIRDEVTKILNERDMNIVGEDMIALLSIIAEGVIMSIKRDAATLESVPANK